MRGCSPPRAARSRCADSPTPTPAPRGQLRAALGYVPQDSFLFSERYRDNIAFGSDAPLSEARLHELIELACMREEVAHFPQGIETLVGERGVTLSGGQRQRTCIA